jgi:hypothetical protein
VVAVRAGAGGLVGEAWPARPSKDTPDRSPSRERQLTVMNARAIGAIAERDAWALAGDQLYLDLDLSQEALAPETRLAIGTAVIEVSAVPHTGCVKFSARFGSDALKWVNNETGCALRLRGINAKVVTAGTVTRGDTVRRI